MTIAGQAQGDPFTAALETTQPEFNLRMAVRGMLANGRDRDTILDELEELRAYARNGPHPESEDAVLNVMDAVSGWTSPGLRL